MMNIRSVYAWSWIIQAENGTWMLCHWAEPTKERLLAGSKPSWEARPVRVGRMSRGDKESETLSRENLMPAM